MARTRKPSAPDVPPPQGIAEICAEFEIEIIGKHAVRDVGQTCAVGTMKGILRRHGESHLRLVLMTIMETGDNQTELVEQTLWAISNLIHEHREWADSGSEWLEAFDTISLGQLRAIAKMNMRIVQQRQGIGTLVFERLLAFFGAKEQARVERERAEARAKRHALSGKPPPGKRALANVKRAQGAADTPQASARAQRTYIHRVHHVRPAAASTGRRDR